jgi:hypothetical protein
MSTRCDSSGHGQPLRQGGLHEVSDKGAGKRGQGHRKVGALAIKMSVAFRFLIGRVIMLARENLVSAILVTVLSLSYGGPSYAQSCDPYPFQAMDTTVEIEGVGGFKILATGAATVDFDDPSEIVSARREAELLAKRLIAEYINQRLVSADLIESEILKSRTSKKATDGSIVTTARRDEVKSQLMGISASSDVVLKGVLVIGSCYTRGREIRVTVGVKSETVDNAKKLERKFEGPKAESPSQRQSTTRKFNENRPLESYDRSEGIKKF